MCDCYAPPKREDPPRVPVMPASLEIETREIDAGWWDWNIRINEEIFENNGIAAWKNDESIRRHFNIKLYCSEVYDPIPEPHCFIRRLIDNCTDESPEVWRVNEEGRITTFKVWTLSYRVLQLEIEAKSEHGREEIFYRYDLLVDRQSFIELFMKTFGDFGTQGGWGWHCNSIFKEDGEVDPKKITLDSRNKVNQ